MFNLLRYYLYRLRHPELADYLDMGFGIEARYKRCKRYWSPHLTYSKRFIELFLKDKNLESVAILGAGRLHDVPISFLATRFKKIHLFDIDPSAEPYWRKIKVELKDQVELDWTICDVSGSILDWSLELRGDRITSAKRLTEVLCSLTVSKSISLSGFDVVISLNTLSQIPIHWRDRVIKFAEQRLRVSTDQNGDLPEVIQSALNKNLSALELSHLQLLSKSSANYVIVITDREFDYYQHFLANWQSEPALFIAPDPELPISIVGYDLDGFDSWLWHISPQHIENEDYGVIHRIWAGFFRRVEI